MNTYVDRDNIRPEATFYGDDTDVPFTMARAQSTLSRLDERTQILLKKDLGNIEERINNACKLIDDISQKIDDYEKIKEKTLKNEINTEKLLEVKDNIFGKIIGYSLKFIFLILILLTSISIGIVIFLTQNPTIIYDIVNILKN